MHPKSISEASLTTAPPKVQAAGRRTTIPRSDAHQFIVLTPQQSLSRDNRRLIKSHASRQSRRPRTGPKALAAWTSPAASKPTGYHREILKSLQLIKPSVGLELDPLGLPDVIKPYMKYILDPAFGPYPLEIVTFVDPLRTAWTAHLLQDTVYLHSMLFWIEAFKASRRGDKDSPLAQAYLIKTLRLLQNRISDPEDPLLVADPTIMVIVGLAVSSELFGDNAAAEKHMTGLYEIVNLRGGLGKLKSDNHRLPTKVCRVDIGFALRFGCNPLFFGTISSWEPYLLSTTTESLLDIASNDEEAQFLSALDSKLVNVWKDLREFARISNLAGQTGYRMSPTVFSEILVSIFYRLLRLQFDDCIVSEALRQVMMAFASVVFFRWQGMKERQAFLRTTLRDVLGRLDRLDRLDRLTTQTPAAIYLWIQLTAEIFLDAEGSQLRREVLKKAIREAGTGSWVEVRNIAKSLIWIDCIFDQPGEDLYQHAIGSRAEDNS